MNVNKSFWLVRFLIAVLHSPLGIPIRSSTTNRFSSWIAVGSFMNLDVDDHVDRFAIRLGRTIVTESAK